MLSATIRAATRRSIATNIRATTFSSLNCSKKSLPSTSSYLFQQQQQQNDVSIRQYTTPTTQLLMPVKTIDVPTMGDSITEGTIVDIPVAPGDYVHEEDVVLVLETDKVSVDVRAPEGGKIVEILGEVDDIVEVGSDLYRLDTDAEAPAGSGGGGGGSASPSPTVETTPEPVVAASAPAPAAAKPTPTPPPKAAPTPPPPPSLPAMESVTTSLGNRPERRSKMSRMR